MKRVVVVPGGSLRPMWRHVGAGRWMLLAGLVSIVFDAVFQSAVPVVFRSVLTALQEDPEAFVEHGWRPLAAVAAAIMVGFLACAYVAHTFTLRAAARWARGLRVALFEHVQRMSADYFARNRVGELSSRINQDVERFEVALRQIMAAIWAVAMLVLAVAFMAWIDPLVAAVALALIGIGAGASALVLPRQRRLSRQVRDQIGATSGLLSDFLVLNPLIKAYSGEDRVAELVSVQTDEVRRKSERLIQLQFLFTDFFAAHLGFLAPFVLLFVCAWRVRDGVLLVGDLVVVWACWQRGAGALTSLTANLPEVLAGLAAADRVAELLRERPSILDGPISLPADARAASLSFEGVFFHYPQQPQRQILDNLSLEVQAGERVALVGPSGGGKSTLCQLLLRFYDVERGAVRVAGQDVRELKLRSLRDHVGIVFQESVFLGGTLADNLRFGAPGADESAMRRALESAFAWEFVRAWPEGLQTQIGDGGVQLSGGERQRLAIARLILKAPPVVLLDEPTSALDAGAEAEVLAAIETLLDGRTSLTIAHRMATIQKSDRIVVLAAGRIVDQGTHEALLARCQVYETYCRQQSVA